jgi:hypothetical protein
VVHARNLDWMKVDYIIDYPTLIVRFPDEGLRSVVFGFPGNISPYSGMNEAGLSLASNEAHGSQYPDRDGHCHTQMQHQLLHQAHSLDEVRAFFEAENHVSAEIVVATDGNTGEAAVFEMAHGGMAERPLSDDGVLYATNHFVADGMTDLHLLPSVNSASRLTRLEQLLEPDGEDSRYGALDLAAAVGVLRDTFDPSSGETHPPDMDDGGNSIANNGAIQAMVFLPADGALYIADGGVPIPQNPFTGFTLDELFLEEGAVGADPAQVP